VEDENHPGPVAELLKECGLKISFAKDMGEAKHVFTHRVWNMKLLHFELLEKPSDEWLLEQQARLVNREEMDALPFPSAMSAAVQAARKLI